MLIMIHTDNHTVHEKQTVLRSQKPFNIAYTSRFMISFINPYFNVDSKWFTLKSSWFSDVSGHLYRFKAHIIL